MADEVADRFAVVDAMTRAAVELGWVPISAESHAGLVMLTVRPLRLIEGRNIPAPG